MSLPCLVPLPPLEIPVSDWPARLDCLESLSLLYISFLTHKAKTPSWTPPVLYPKRPCADDHGSPVPRSGAGRQRGWPTRWAEHIGSRDRSDLKGAGSLFPTYVARQHKWLSARRRGSRHAKRNARREMADRFERLAPQELDDYAERRRRERRNITLISVE
jgi:hypothetical protein